MFTLSCGSVQGGILVWQRRDKVLFDLPNPNLSVETTDTILVLSLSKQETVAVCPFKTRCDLYPQAARC